MNSLARRLFVPVVLCFAFVAIFTQFAPPARSQANVTGQWQTLPTTMPINPVHSALLKTGKVLIVSGSGNVAANKDFEAAIWDPQTDTVTTQPIAWDMFCDGMVVLPDGRPFILGGTLQYDPFFGEQRTAIYNAATGAFTDAQSMAHGRWYPTGTVLGDGRVMVFSGLSETGGTNTTVEIYTVGSGWSAETAAPWTPPLYPRLHVLPNGTVFYSGSGTDSALFTPSTNSWVHPIANTNFSTHRTYGSSVLLPLTPANGFKPRVMILGGSNPSTATTEIIDLSVATPQWVFGPSMSQPRIEMNATLLPNGKVLALGGSLNDEDTTTASLNADLYDPNANTFSSAGTEAFARLYHSVSLLLPDGTVWVAGGNPTRGTYEKHMEIYSPAYLFNSNGTLATRPTITSLSSSVLGYGGAFTINTPDAANVSSVVLMRNGAVTHAFNMDQRLVGLSFTAGSGVLNVTAPANGNLAPPGYYMVFILNAAGVPSLASMVQLSPAPGDVPPTGTITSPASNVTINMGQSVSYSGTGTDPDGTITAFSWSLNGGNPSTSNLANPGAVTYPTAGIYNATLTVTDNAGLTDPNPPTRTITVNQLPDFSLSVSPSSTTVTQGSSATYTVTSTAVVGFTGTVSSFTVSGLPTGASASFNPTSIPASGTTTMTISTLGSTPAGGYSLTVGATSGALSHTATTALAVSQSGGSSSINFASGFSSSTGLQFNGHTKLNGSRLQLTDNSGPDEAASAFWTTPVNVQTFTNNFTFQLTNPAADGFTFTIQNAGPGALGQAGGLLGYAGATKITPSVAVKFDLANNAGEGNNSTGLYTDGAAPNVPATTFGGGVNLHSGDILQVQMTYDGTTLSMTVTDTKVPADTFTISFPINIPATVGSNTALVGFTGGTGALTATQEILTWTYGTSTPAPTPVISPATGSFSSPQAVSMTDSAPGATIFYTLDGTMPTTSSTQFTTPFTVTGTTTVTAIATAPTFSQSAPATSVITIQGGGSTPINFSSGFSTTGMQFNGSTVLNGTRLQLTNAAATKQAASAFWTTPVNIQSFTNNFTFQLTSPAADGFTFTIQNAGPTALGGNGGLLGYAGVTKITPSVAVKFDLANNAGEGNNSTGLYTDGAAPSVPATTLGGGVNLHSGDIFRVQMTYDGTTLTMTITDTGVPTDTFTISFPINIPGTVGGNTALVGFTGGTGGLSATQEILTWTYSTSGSGGTPDFAISSSPVSQTVMAGGSTTYNVAIAAVAGFTGTVTLSASGLPADATASFNPATVTTSGTSTMTVTTSGASTTGSSPLTITGTSGALTHSASSTLVITTGPDFSVSASPASQTVTAGNSTTYTVTIGALGGFAGAVTLSASGLPAGASASFNPTTVTTSGTSTMTVTTSTTTPAATSTLTVTGTSGALTHSATTSLVVTAAPVPDFSIGAAPASQTVAAGNSTTYTVTIGALNGFTGTVTLSASGLPTGASASFNPTTITASGSSTMTVTTGTTTPAATSTLTVTGTSGALTHSATTSLVVTAAPVPDFTIGASPGTQTVTAGTSTTYTVTIGALNGFTGTVTLSATGLPTGASASFNPTTVTTSGTSTMTVTTSTTTPAATSTLTVTGTSGALTHSATTSLVVTAAPVPDFTIGASPGTQTVTAGNSTTYTVTIGALNGFAGTVTLSASGLPTGASASFNPTTVTTSGTSTMTVTTSITTPAATSTLTVTGTSGALTHSATTSLTVTPAPVADFSIGASPATQTVTAGNSTTYTVTIGAINGFTGTVTLTASGLPTGAAASFNPTTVTTSGTSTMTVTTSTTTPAATSTLTVTGTSGALTHSATTSLTVQSGTSSTPVNFATGFSAAGLQFNGTTVLNGTRLQLTTSAATKEAASAFWTTPVNVQSFTNNFTFQLTNPAADGFTFTIQNAGLTALGPHGGGLGYGPSTLTGVPGIKTSVAVKFDLANNNGEGNNSTGLYTNGASPTTPATTFGGGVNLHSGDIFQVQMTYDGTTLTMTITDTKVPADTFTIAFPINIPATVGGNTALVGFTAGTGALTSTQEILTWTYSTP
jgi:hypothetical protein